MSDQKPAMSPYEAGLELHAMAKPDGDPDLVQQVRGFLVEAGVSEEGLVRNFDEHRYIKTSVGKASPVQRSYLVRFTDLTLKRSVIPSQTLMSDLPINGSLEPWTKQMKSKIAPFIAKHKLLEK